MGLTQKQKLFADYYISNGGNGSEAYKKAYTTCKKDETARVNASKLLTNANVLQYVAERNEELSSSRIADMKEVKEFWTESMRDTEAELKDRLKASEFIAKSNGAFLDKVEHTGNIPVMIVDDIDD